MNALNLEKPAALIRQLSKRKREICQQLVKGLTDKEIGRELGISHNTVSNHLKDSYKLLEVSCRPAAIAYLVEGLPTVEMDKQSELTKAGVYYRATCDKMGKIKTAGDGFCRLLAKEVRDWNEKLFPRRFLIGSQTKTICIGDTPVTIIKIDDGYQLELWLMKIY
jgi:DNA-binding CsgD family transcriptional regulator